MHKGEKEKNKLNRVVWVMDFVPFMFFSIFEAICLMALIMSIYRFSLKECPWHVVLAATITSLQSYFLREELSLSALAPLLYVVIITLLLNLILSVPLHWSLFVTAVGYFGYAMIQLLVIVLSFGWLSLTETTDHHYKGYIVQLLSGLIAYLLARFLYSRGIGFSFDFKSKRIQFERFITYYLIPAIVLVFGYFLYQRDLLIIFFLLAIAIGYFIYFSIMKERNNR